MFYTLFLYKKTAIADIKIVLLFAVLFYLILIFPIFINLKVGYIGSIKKALFGAYLYSKIKTFSGYIEGDRSGLFLHYSNKKALLINYNSIRIKNDDIDLMKEYNVLKVKTWAEIPIKELSINLATYSFVLNYANVMLKRHLLNRKSYLKIHNNADFILCGQDFNFVLEIVVVFNILTVIITLLKLLVRKIINER